MKTLAELREMSVDEKIEMAITELEELNLRRETRCRRRRKEDLKLALECWWMVKKNRG